MVIIFININVQEMRRTSSPTCATWSTSPPRWTSSWTTSTSIHSTSSNSGVVVFFYKILSSVVSITNHHQALFQRVPTQVFYLQFCHQYYNSPPSTETKTTIIIIIKTNVVIVIIIINQDRHCCRSACLRRDRSHKTSVWHLGRYGELLYIFIFIYHIFTYIISECPTLQVNEASRMDSTGLLGCIQVLACYNVPRWNPGWGAFRCLL